MKIDRRVLGQNGNGQNGTDKMVYGQNGIIGQNGSGQNGADKMARIKSSIYQSIPKTLTIRFFHQSRFHLTILGFLCIYHLFWTSGYEYKLNSIELKYIKKLLPFCPYHFVHTILSIPYCPIPFCPYIVLSVPFCPLPFSPVTD